MIDFLCVSLSSIPGATALSGAYFGIGTGPINVDDSQCTGDETNITQCVFTSNDNCQHSNDAGVRYVSQGILQLLYSALHDREKKITISSSLIII